MHIARLSMVGLAIIALHPPLHAVAAPASPEAVPETAAAPAAWSPVQRSFALKGISAGQTVVGRLDDDSYTLADGSRYDLFLYRGRAGEQIVITVRSAEFTPFLAGGPAVAGTLYPEDRAHAATDEGVVSFSAVTGRDGTYGIWVNSMHAGEMGGYEIVVHLAPGARRPHAPRRHMESISPGQTLSRTLTARDATLEDESHFHLFVYTGQPGDELVITLRSEEFGTFLTSGMLRNGAFQAEASDHDRADTAMSRLGVTVGDDGKFAIRVNAFRPGATGAYTLHVDRVASTDQEPEPLAPAVDMVERPVEGVWADELPRAATPDRALPDDKDFAAVAIVDPGAKRGV